MTAPTCSSTAMPSTRSTRGGAPCSTSTTRRAPRWPRPGCRSPSAGCATHGPPGWARPSTSTCWRRPSSQKPSATSSPAAWPRPRPPARPPPGCSPTTMSSATPRAMRFPTAPTARDGMPGCSPAAWNRRRTRSAGCAAPAPQRCSCWACPAPPTSTRARSWASSRQRTCPRNPCRTPPGSARNARSRAATGAGCRCRGTRRGKTSASAAPLGFPSRRGSPATRSRRRTAPRVPRWSSTARRWRGAAPCREPNPWSGSRSRGPCWPTTGAPTAGGC